MAFFKNRVCFFKKSNVMSRLNGMKLGKNDPKMESKMDLFEELLRRHWPSSSSSLVFAAPPSAFSLVAASPPSAFPLPTADAGEGSAEDAGLCSQDVHFVLAAGSGVGVERVHFCQANFGI